MLRLPDSISSVGSKFRFYTPFLTAVSILKTKDTEFNLSGKWSLFFFFFSFLFWPFYLIFLNCLKCKEFSENDSNNPILKIQLLFCLPSFWSLSINLKIELVETILPIWWNASVKYRFLFLFNLMCILIIWSYLLKEFFLISRLQMLKNVN